MRSPDQNPACKDPERNDQSPVITFRPTYTSVSNRSGSRSFLKTTELSKRSHKECLIAFLVASFFALRKVYQQLFRLFETRPGSNQTRHDRNRNCHQLWYPTRNRYRLFTKRPCLSLLLSVTETQHNTIKSEFLLVWYVYNNAKLIRPLQHV